MCSQVGRCAIFVLLLASAAAAAETQKTFPNETLDVVSWRLYHAERLYGPHWESVKGVFEAIIDPCINNGTMVRSHA